MRRIQEVLIFICLILVACSSGKKADKQEEKGWEITIKGKVGFPQPGEIVLSEVRNDSQKPYEDTIRLKGNYTFEKKIRIAEPGYYQLNFYRYQYVSLILDKSNLEVNVDGNNPSGFFEVKGSPDADLMSHVQSIISDAQKSEAAVALEAEFQEAARLNNESKILNLQQKYQETVMDKAYSTAADYVRQAPLSLGLINLMQSNSAFDRDKYFALYVDVADKCKTEWRDNQYAKAFVVEVDRMKKTAIGQPAPEIALPDPDGKVITLSSFKGKYVLVDFWAKWCGPCRQENPNVVKAYHQFKHKGFDILGVSLDKSKVDWVRAIQEDGLVWNHVSDLKYFDSQAAKDYNINGIPFSILVDPKGIIIAKNLRGRVLMNKLKEVLNKKS